MLAAVAVDVAMLVITERAGMEPLAIRLLVSTAVATIALIADKDELETIVTSFGFTVLGIAIASTIPFPWVGNHLDHIFDDIKTGSAGGLVGWLYGCHVNAQRRHAAIRHGEAQRVASRAFCKSLS